MAKPRSPKKNTTVNEPALPSTSAQETSAVAAATAPTPETETKQTKTARKPELVRNDGRANLVPINLEDEIRQLAYLYSERRGFIPGHEADDWLAAEREVMQRYHQHTA